MPKPLICVVTTIQPPNECMNSVAQLMLRHGGEMLVIGDRKGPVGFELPGSTFYPLSEQATLPFSLAAKLPVGHYARKNLGYLEAMRKGTACIFETDDDNAPLQNWAPRPLELEAETWSQSGWLNVYRLFSHEFIWPRGFPLDLAGGDLPASPAAAPSLVTAPIQQGLVNESADVDAVWRLLMDRPVTFAARTPVRLSPGTWCPFNSQWTWWWPPVFPLLYLPSYCSFRMTDIWRGFVAQRCLWELGHGLVFYSPDARQVRNPHNLMRDFEDEVPGYLNNAKIALLLDGLRLGPGTSGVGENLLRCYEALVKARLVGEGEMNLAAAWASDCVKVMRPSYNFVDNAARGPAA